jgi:hypothetical protein
VDKRGRRLAAIRRVPHPSYSGRRRPFPAGSGRLGPCQRRRHSLSLRGRRRHGKRRHLARPPVVQSCRTRVGAGDSATRRSGSARAAPGSPGGGSTSEHHGADRLGQHPDGRRGPGGGQRRGSRVGRVSPGRGCARHRAQTGGLLGGRRQSDECGPGHRSLVLGGPSAGRSDPGMVDAGPGAPFGLRKGVQRAPAQL